MYLQRVIENLTLLFIGKAATFGNFSTQTKVNPFTPQMPTFLHVKPTV
jgi:hypothetical protein